MLPCSTFVAWRCGPDVSGLGRGHKRENGAVAERLGRGLQNLLQRFESAQRLRASLEEFSSRFFYEPSVNLGSELWLIKKTAINPSGYQNGRPTRYTAILNIQGQFPKVSCLYLQR